MVKKYFARANTSAGCVSLMDNNLRDIKTVYKLSGVSRTIADKILNEITDNAEKKYVNIECVYNPFDIGKKEAVIIRDIKIAVAAAECTEDIKGNCEIMHVAGGQEDERVKNLESKAKKAYSQLYRAYGEAKKIHDEWEKIYNSEMDFDRLSEYSKGLLEFLIRERKENKGTYNYERFFGASTPDGSVNYIDNITDGLKHRYFIKGRPGTGKSTFMKKLAKAANDVGLDCELYRCSFDKDSLDMVLVPELSLCVFDSTAPHELFPRDSHDSILDFYEESGLSGVDEKYAGELSDVSERYRQRIAEGICFLRLGELYEREADAYMSKTIDGRVVRQITDELLENLL